MPAAWPGRADRERHRRDTTLGEAEVAVQHRDRQPAHGAEQQQPGDHFADVHHLEPHLAEPPPVGEQRDGAGREQHQHHHHQ